MEFENLPKGWIAKEQICSWNQGKPGGWERYRELTEEASEKIEAIIEDKKLTSDEVAKRVEAIETKIKFQSFGKTKPPTKLRLERGVKSARRLESEDAEVDKIFKRQAQELEEAIN